MFSAGIGWRAVPSFRREALFPDYDGVHVYSHSVRCPALDGKKILFFSDVHIRNGLVHCFPNNPSPWRGTDFIQSVLTRAIVESSPDYLVFGGDLFAEAAWMNDAFKMLKDLPEVPHRIAIFGNWELNREWIPADHILSCFEKARFTVLRNRGESFGNLFFYGTDDFKGGDPAFPDSFPDAAFRCLLCHNPDAIPLISPSLLQQTDLILAGHTHSGQFRIPGFGALYSGTTVWKRFESGLYRSKKSNAELLVCAGLGTTWIPLRIFCPPELLLIRFTS